MPDFDHIVYPSGEHNLTASIDGQEAGHIWWWCDGEMEVVYVHPDMRRRGIATELWDRARAITPDLRHSSSMTADGRAWSQSCGCRLR